MPSLHVQVQLSLHMKNLKFYIKPFTHLHKLLLQHHSIHHTIFASQICSIQQLHLFTIYTPISCNRRGVDVVSFIKRTAKLL